MHFSAGKKMASGTLTHSSLRSKTYTTPIKMYMNFTISSIPSYSVSMVQREYCKSLTFFLPHRLGIVYKCTAVIFFPTAYRALISSTNWTSYFQGVLENKNCLLLGLHSLDLNCLFSSKDTAPWNAHTLRTCDKDLKEKKKFDNLSGLLYVQCNEQLGYLSTSGSYSVQKIFNFFLRHSPAQTDFCFVVL